MTEYKEINEEVNEQLSTDDLKSVSGGLTRELMNRGRRTNDPTETGSGMTRRDYDKSVGIIVDPGGGGDPGAGDPGGAGGGDDPGGGAPLANICFQ